MTQFLLTIGRDDRLRPEECAYADIVIIEAAAMTAGIHKRLDDYNQAAGLKREGGRRQTARPLWALFLPFSWFQSGKDRQESGALPVPAAVPVTLFFFAVPPGAAAGERNSRAAALWARAAAFTARHDSLLVLPYRQDDEQALPAEDRPPGVNSLTLWLEKARAGGFKGVVLSCPALPAAAARAAFIAFAGRFMRQARAAGLRAGIMGALQVPDIPRLLAFAPDYLGCPAAVGKQWSETVSAMAHKAEASGPAGHARAAPAENRDKILVSDYIVPVHIGAYAHEKAAAQPVCFNIIAEIVRPARPPQAIGEVFSYDIILDAIEAYAAAGPVELVETLAEQLAAFLLTFPPVRQVTVRVEKLQLAARAVGVEITRRREQG